MAYRLTGSHRLRGLGLSPGAAAAAASPAAAGAAESYSTWAANTAASYPGENAAEVAADTSQSAYDQYLNIHNVTNQERAQPGGAAPLDAVLASMAATPSTSSYSVPTTPAMVSQITSGIRMLGPISAQLPGVTAPAPAPGALVAATPVSSVPVIGNTPEPTTAPQPGYYWTTDANGDWIQAPAVSSTGANPPSTPAPAGYQYTTDANGNWILTPIASATTPVAATPTSGLTIFGETFSTTTVLVVAGGVALVLYFMFKKK